jgi:phenylalanyl-tRNA synthetase alpha chain
MRAAWRVVEKGILMLNCTKSFFGLRGCVSAARQILIPKISGRVFRFYARPEILAKPNILQTVGIYSDTNGKIPGWRSAVEMIWQRRNEEKMKNKLEQIREKAISQLNNCDTADKLNEIRVSILGKKGELTDLLKSMRDVPPQERPKVGQMVNETRAEIEKFLEERRTKIERAVREAKMAAEVIDVTLPAKKAELGHRHPDTIVLEEVERIFVGMGYEVVEGPEVEKDYYNFEALNIPADHPAKDEQDTFYITGDILLRTQTSGVQVHEMEKGKLPIRMIAPGRVFRSDEVDATHSPCFHQIEGLVIDRHITFADLKGTLAEFARELFGAETKVKFRPHHFPFTEPSAEMDVTCFKCGGKGCRFCKGSGWIEILGCGMVHPHVLEMSGIDPEEYTGFAFGVGLERITLLKYEIDDMRLLYENDIRFLKQF